MTAASKVFSSIGNNNNNFSIVFGNILCSNGVYDALSMSICPQAYDNPHKNGQFNGSIDQLLICRDI